MNDQKITIICPLCGGRTDTNERAIGCMLPCPHCGKEIVFNIIESEDGMMEAHIHERLEMHDFAAMSYIAKIQLEQQKENIGPSKREFAEIIEKIRKHRAAYRRKEPQRGLVKLCEDFILKDWAYLDDLPKELANTVANIYYNYCEFTVLMTAVKNGDISQSEMLRELGIDRIEKDFVMSVTKVLPSYQSKVVGDYKTINEMINNLRQMDQEKQPK